MSASILSAFSFPRLINGHEKSSVRLETDAPGRKFLVTIDLLSGKTFAGPSVAGESELAELLV